ncbi:methyl-accepting chemotaxis protein [Noviherbaspirillum aridicola]|uniref:Methyl-accepting chemotaxis protein I n=1 Tax=Noviherbaspirillum aridicola TaxID=2849687 RepID=A0ABQ4QAP3_9BURK|nr:methyl-accepting chemotaxis protein [Noviherbaspirillum aridicola]GIZ53962.1 methyl-accepting chemotaxis protein I [Noviherbaspirillum aridicola]
MLKNLTLRTRLVAVLALLCIQLVVGGIIGIVTLSGANSALRVVYEERLVRLGLLDQVVRLIDENESGISKVLTGEQSGLEASLKAIAERNKLIDAKWSEFMSGDLSAEERKLADEFAARHKKYVAEGMKPAIEALTVLDTQSAVTAVHGPMTELLAPVREQVNALIKRQLDAARMEYEQAESTYEIVRMATIGGVLAGLFVAVAIGAMLVRTITGQLGMAVKVAESVADGDLTQDIRVNSNDETGKLMAALRHMNESLAEIVSKVRTGTETIATASAQIASGNADLSARTEHQAGSLEETASSLEELTSTVKQNAESARQANQLAANASTVAHDGGEVVSQVVNTMGDIQAASRKIVDIISVIDGIAFQTNILALNAAVEAARAGEQGRGFAVVASEVRSLAQRSAQAAREIKVLISSTVEKVDGGTTLVGQAGAKMDEVVQSIRQVATIMHEIMQASQEQTSGIEQISQAVSQMDQVTQQNAALVEEALAASENMRSQAAGLAEAVSVFRLQGQAAAAPRLEDATGQRKLLTA